jgi:hypothetical protein
MTEDTSKPGLDRDQRGADAPETVNRDQNDEPQQAQTLAGEARIPIADLALHDSDKGESGVDAPEAQDVVEHMRQMVTSGRIDMSAYRGERSDDDTDELGEQGIDDDSPRLTG